MENDNECPQVDVLLPVFNGMPYLRQAVQSILEQEDIHFRLIVLNDGSTDGTLPYLTSIHDERVEIHSWSNAGLAATLNRGLELANAPYIARMDADDIAHPNRLQRQVHFLESHPAIALVGTQVTYFGQRRSMAHGKLPLEHDDIVANLLTGRHALSHPSVMMRRRVVEQVGGYWPRGVSEDTDLFLRIADEGRLANLPDVLLNYRFHSGSITARQLRDVHELIDVAAVAWITQAGRLDANQIEHVRSRLPETTERERRIRMNLSYRVAMDHYLNGGRIRGAVHLAGVALRDPARAGARAARMVRGVLKSGATLSD